VLHTDRGGLLGAELAGGEGAEDDDLTTGTGDGDVQTSLAPRPVQRPEVEGKHASFVHGERRREQDDIALVALDVLEVLDEEPLVLPIVQRLDEPLIARVTQKRFDVGPLLLVESDDADRWESAEGCVARVLSRLLVTFVQLRVAEY
jgi:hypothetical protein